MNIKKYVYDTIMDNPEDYTPMKKGPTTIRSVDVKLRHEKVSENEIEKHLSLRIRYQSKYKDYKSSMLWGKEFDDKHIIDRYLTHIKKTIKEHQ